MTSVGGRRQYRSEIRQQQAAATRARILRSARELFLERGYPAATLQQVADHAGVALPTVTGIFANKRTLLDEVLRRAVRGQNREQLSPREQLQAVLAAPDADALLAAHAELIAQANERAHELFEIVRKAATVEPPVEAQRQKGAADRRADQAAVVREIARRDALRPGLSVQHATDILWLYSSADVYRLLVVDRGWSIQRFTTWLRRTLTDTLLEQRARKRMGGGRAG
jgi:AcrR family transcriptional regulator